jgi:uncharacterized membrane protein
MDRTDTAGHLHGFRWYRRSRLWVVPSAGVVAALLLATASLSLDHLVISDGAPFPIFSGEPDTARTILSLIATSIATLTALVLTIVAVVIQLATQSLSPRAVRTFLQDVHSHLTIGTFVATFTYVLVVLQQFQATHDANGEEEMVASSSLTIAFVMAVVSLGMFISYVDHIIHQARVTSIIDRIGDATRSEIEERYPPEERAPEVVTGEVPDGDPDRVIRSDGNGVILEIDVPGLLQAIQRLDVVVVMIPAVGDFIPTGGRLFEVYGAADVDADRVLATVEIDAERSIVQDVPFGMRLLVDIAQRSLSSGINDPTTATQVIDELHDLLLVLGSRAFPGDWHADENGAPRLRVTMPTWELYVALAFEEIRSHGAGILQVMRRLRSAVEDLMSDLPEHRHPALQRQITMLDETVESAFKSELERAAALCPDAQGIGSGAGFVPVHESEDTDDHDPGREDRVDRSRTE